MSRRLEQPPCQEMPCRSRGLSAESDGHRPRGGRRRRIEQRSRSGRLPRRMAMRRAGRASIPPSSGTGGGYNGRARSEPRPLTWRNLALIATLLDYVLHLDKHLHVIIQDYGVWTYLILFVIIFCETGLVVTPFLPGDSLLFAIGTFAALGSLDLGLTLVLLSLAAILGDAVNYAIGYRVGPRVFSRGRGALPQPGLPRPHAPLLRALRGQDHRDRALRPDHPHLRAVRGGDRPDDLRALRALQRGGGHRLDPEPHPRGLSRSAISRWCERTSPW